MFSRSNRLSFSVVLLCIIISPGIASAAVCNPPGTPAIYTINSSNSDLLQVDFENQCVDVINDDANQLTSPRDIVVVQDPERGTGIVVVDQDNVCIYQLADGSPLRCELITADIPRGVSGTVLSTGGLVIANSGPGDSADQQEQLHFIPTASTDTGFADAPELTIDVPCERIEQIKSVPFDSSEFAVDDLIVACDLPAQVLHYEVTSNGGWTRTNAPFIPPSKFVDGGPPTGIAFAPDKKVLISETTGVIRRFDDSGQEASVTFFDDLGMGSVRLAAGPETRLDQSGDPFSVNIVLATQLNTGTIHRLKVVEEGGELIGEVDGIPVTGFVASPSGTDCTTCRSVPVELDDTVSAAPGLLSTYEVVENVFGFASGRAILIEEDSLGTERELSNLPGLNLPAVKVPGHMTGMPRDGKAGKWFLLYQLTSSIEVAPGTVLHHAEESDFGFNFGAECEDLPFNESPQAAYAPETETAGSPLNEPPTVEGDVFANVDLGCSPAYLWRGFSARSLYLGGFDTRTPSEMASDKCVALKQALGLESVPQGVLAGLFTGDAGEALLADVSDATENACLSVERNRTRRALRQIEDIVELMNDNTDLVANDVRNVTGEVVVRAKSIASTLCRGYAGKKPPRQCATLVR